MLGGVVLDDLGGIVTGAVIDDQDFGIPLAVADVSEDAVEACANPRAFVVGGNDDAVGGGHELVVDRWLLVVGENQDASTGPASSRIKRPGRFGAI